MKLESQVCSLELSKQLKGAGVPQESLFYWTTPENGQIMLTFGKRFYSNPEGSQNEEQLNQTSAFTVAELGEMLPLNQKFPDIGKSEYGDWFVNFTRGHQDHFAKEAEARGQMLLYLINQKLIDLK